MARTAEQIRKTLAGQVKALRDDRDLSEEGRQRQIARVYVQANIQMQKLRKAAGQSREERYEKLHRKMFGNPTAGDPASAINFRDAQERAERVKDPDEARRLMARAHASGDAALGKALAMRALESAGTPLGNGWVPLINEWAVVNGVDAELTEISSLMQPVSRVSEDLGFALSKPAEIQRMTGFGEVEKAARLADSEEDDGGAVLSFNSSRPGELSWLPETG